jgi:hypothetical protein
VRQLQSPELKVTVRPDLARDKLLIRLGAATFSCSHDEALALIKQIIAALDELILAHYRKRTDNRRASVNSEVPQ